MAVSSGLAKSPTGGLPLAVLADGELATGLMNVDGRGLDWAGVGILFRMFELYQSLSHVRVINDK